MAHKKMPPPKIIKVELENSYCLVTRHNSVCDGGVNKAAVLTAACKGGYANAAEPTAHARVVMQVYTHHT